MTNFNLEVDKRCHECDTKKEDYIPLFEKGISILGKQEHLKDKMNGGTLKLFFVSDEEIRQINRNYRDKDEPTDVISISYFEESDFPAQNLLGEIFISVDTAHRQAKEHNVTTQEEAKFLFVHGLLHVFGYDHKKPEDEKIMFSLKDEILGSKKWRQTM